MSPLHVYQAAPIPLTPPRTHRPVPKARERAEAPEKKQRGSAPWYVTFKGPYVLIFQYLGV
jgi:hypothetical protein